MVGLLLLILKIQSGYLMWNKLTDIVSFLFKCCMISYGLTFDYAFLVTITPSPSVVRVMKLTNFKFVPKKEQ